MSLESRLPRVLRRRIAKVVRSIGVPCVVRRPRPVTDQADNSSSVVWEGVPTLPDPIAIVLDRLSDQQRQRVWGDRIEASMIGLTELAHGLQGGDIVRPTKGAFRDRHFEITGCVPQDLATTIDLFLREVPAGRDYGF